jgi:hypothetical protein
LELQVVKQLRFVPIEVLDHLKKMPTEGEFDARSPRSSQPAILQLVLIDFG